MNRKMWWLAILPIYGTVIMVFLLFIKVFRRELEMKKFMVCLFSSGLLGFLSILIAVLLFKFLNFLFIGNNFLNNYGLALGFLLGGYLMNFFVFTMIIKKM